MLAGHICYNATLLLIVFKRIKFCLWRLSVLWCCYSGHLGVTITVREQLASPPILPSLPHPSLLFLLFFFFEWSQCHGTFRLSLFRMMSATSGVTILRWTYLVWWNQLTISRKAGRGRLRMEGYEQQSQDKNTSFQKWSSGCSLGKQNGFLEWVNLMV